MKKFFTSLFPFFGISVLLSVPREETESNSSSPSSSLSSSSSSTSASQSSSLSCQSQHSKGSKATFGKSRVSCLLKGKRKAKKTIEQKPKHENRSRVHSCCCCDNNHSHCESDPSLKVCSPNGLIQLDLSDYGFFSKGFIPPPTPKCEKGCRKSCKTCSSKAKHNMDKLSEVDKLPKCLLVRLF